MRKESREDREKYGDKRRTIIVECREAQVIKEVELTAVEPVTAVLSTDGWVRAARAARGHEVDPTSLYIKLVMNF